MTRRRNVPVLLVAGFLFVFVVSGTAFQQRRPPHNQPWGPVYKPSISADLRRYEQHRRRFRTHPAEARAMLLHWNDIATDAVALDHAAALFEAEGLYGDQLGPTRSSRALAIVHIAMFDAVNAFGHEYRSYSPMPPAPFGASMSAAIAQSAHDTLVDLYPSQVDSFNEELADDLACLADGPGKPWGIWLGKRAAALILAAREHDGAGPPGTPEPEVGVDYFPSPAPGKWRPDPISMADIALGARWGRVRPFVISSGARYRAAPPPDLTSGEYTDAYNEVKRIGGDGITTPTERTEEQTLIGLFWAYDGTPYIGTPPNLFKGSR